MMHLFHVLRPYYQGLSHLEIRSGSRRPCSKSLAIRKNWTYARDGSNPRLRAVGTIGREASSSKSSYTKCIRI